MSTAPQNTPPLDDAPRVDTAPPRRFVARLSFLAADIKLSHSIFALPFALLATFLAARGWPGGARLLLIVVCMGFARTFAMLANRYFDRAIDARNPRTAGRALPAGRLTEGDVIGAMALCAAGLIAAAAMFGVNDRNWLPLILSPAVLLWLGAYGLMKRFTLLCHFFLGAALAISPLAAGIAIDPESLQAPTLWYLAGFVLLWVGGFDVIYALQDIDVDQREKLHSIPAALGRTGALTVARIVHVVALLVLIQMWHSTPLLQHNFRWGILAVGTLLTIEHTAASRGKFTMAFFTVNGFISLILGGLGIWDVMR